MTRQPEREPIECAYCGKDFDSEHERGRHISKKHVEEDDKYTKEPEADTQPYKNIVDDWKDNINQDGKRSGMV